MKYIAAISVSALIFAIAAVTHAQSLADLANKEKERRENIKADSKVITNNETPNYKNGAVTTGSLPPPPSVPTNAEETRSEAEVQTGSSVDPYEPVDFEGRPESFWRKTMSEARQKVKDLENEKNVITLKLADLQTQFYGIDDGFRQQAVQREIQKTLYEQDLNKENLAKAIDELKDLEKEARKSGALPGWITSKNP